VVSDLCIVHPGGLSAACWAGLRAYLPLTLLQLGRWDDDSVDDLAQRLSGELDAVPRVLLGWGFGGVVAHALAERLGGGHVVVLDGVAPGVELALEAPRLERWFEMYLAATGQANREPLYENYVRCVGRTHALSSAAVAGARPLTLVKAADSLLPESPALGWDAHAPVELLASAGNHYTMVTDPCAVAHLAALLRRWIR
jgi:thioesterase domain-containing protein